MTTHIYGNARVASSDAIRSSTSARIAIAGIAIAARNAGNKPGCTSGAPPTGAISEAKKAGSIIVTGNAPTGIANGHRKPA